MFCTVARVPCPLSLTKTTGAGLQLPRFQLAFQPSITISVAFHGPSGDVEECTVKFAAAPVPVPAVVPGGTELRLLPPLPVQLAKGPFGAPEPSVKRTRLPSGVRTAAGLCAHAGTAMF